jgi:hypothetical protein
LKLSQLHFLLLHYFYLLIHPPATCPPCLPTFKVLLNIALDCMPQKANLSPCHLPNTICASLPSSQHDVLHTPPCHEHEFKDTPPKIWTKQLQLRELMLKDWKTKGTIL